MEMTEQRAAEKEKKAREKKTNIVGGDFQSIIEAFTATLFAAPRQPGNLVGTIRELQTGKFKDAAGSFAAAAQQILGTTVHLYEKQQQQHSGSSTNHIYMNICNIYMYIYICIHIYIYIYIYTHV